MAGLMSPQAGMMMGGGAPQGQGAPMPQPMPGNDGQAQIIQTMRQRFNSLPPEKKAEIGALATPQVATALMDLGLTQLAQFLQSYAANARPAPGPQMTGQPAYA